MVADLSVVWVHASLYEKDLRLIRPGMAVVVHVQGYPEATFPGKLLRSGLRVDEKTRTIDLQIEAPNGSLFAWRWWSSRHAVQALACSRPRDLEVSRADVALTVPVSAVQTMDGLPVVFVPHGRGAGRDGRRRRRGDVRCGRFARREARRCRLRASEAPLGMRDAEVVEILKGLKVGESVCAENAFLLKSELEKSKLAEED